MIFLWLRKHLKLQEQESHTKAWRAELTIRHIDLIKRLDGMEKSLAASNSGMARIIAKLDPMFGVPEDDPVRKEQSNKLGENIIKRLIGEHLARQHTEGKSNG